MNWYPNGIIFQELCRPTKFSCDFSYESLNAYHQNPLSGINDTACKELSMSVSYHSNEDGTCTPLEFISNLGLAAKYITLCRKEKMMHVRKDNWDVQEIDFEQFTALKENTFTIGSAFNHPKQYFLLSEHHHKFQILIEQSSIGLHDVPFISFLDKNQILLCLTDSCVVIDYKNKAVRLQQELNTPCVDIVCIDDIAYIVCEADIIKYSVKDNVLFDPVCLSDAVKEISDQNGTCLITLYDGNFITLPY